MLSRRRKSMTPKTAVPSIPSKLRDNKDEKTKMVSVAQAAKENTENAKEKPKDKSATEKKKQSAKEKPKKQIDDADYVHHKKYYVGWSFEVPDEPRYKGHLRRAEKGDFVVVDRWLPPGEKRDFETPVVRRDPNNIGYVSLYYLVPAEDWKKPSPAKSGRWFAGQIGPIEASILLDRDGGEGRKNTCVVIEPPEYETKTNWPECLMLVRTIDGSERQFHHNCRSNPTNAKFDRLPTNRREPMPAIAYLRIQRTNEGRYFILPGGKTEPSLTRLMKKMFKKNEIPIDFDCRPYPGNLEITSLLYHDDEYAIKCTPAPPLIYEQRQSNASSKRCDNLLFVQKEIKMEELVRVAEHAGDHNVGVVYESKLTSATNTASNAPTSCQFAVCELTATMVKPGQREVTTFAEKLVDAELEGEILRSVAELRKTEMKVQRGHNYVAKIFTTDYRIEDDHLRLTLIGEWIGAVSLLAMLRDRREKRSPLPTRGLLEIMYQIAAGCRFLERNGLFHGQLCAQNVLVRREFFASMSVKLSDCFLYASIFARPQCRRLFTTRLAASRLQWRHMAPETFDGRFDSRADVWSFGVTMVECMTYGQPAPFGDSAANATEHMRNLQQQRVHLATSDDWPDFVQHFVGECVQLQPDRRPKFDRLYRFFNDLLFDAVAGPNDALLQYIRRPKHKSSIFQL